MGRAEPIGHAFIREDDVKKRARPWKDIDETYLLDRPSSSEKNTFSYPEIGNPRGTNRPADTKESRVQDYRPQNRTPPVSEGPYKGASLANLKWKVCLYVIMKRRQRPKKADYI